MISTLSMVSGIPRNTLITRAVNDFLANNQNSSIPLEGEIKEREFNLMEYENITSTENGKRLYENIDELFLKPGIWTKKPGDTSGNPTPGFYGRNTVIGYVSESRLDEPMILSKHQENYGFGPLINYKYEITPLSDWLKYMHKIKISS
ncbi:hypothetical protein OYC61_018520 [Alcaligenes nematophilus]|uniref:Uncharacterized protein n=1 Tax=Alcaligenes nematophilus TaxID=2994643 RepID=A0ABU3MY35_9BURK|nr:hypothetical protein [Alcaligenes nematophilus]MDT8506305.1 hypothetical protein [Alcaligenes nematophilus]